MATTKQAGLSSAQMARRLEIGEQRRAQMRARLVQAAYQLFARHGAEAPTIDDIVQEADVARGTFYNHFSSREELFNAVADDLASGINDSILPVIKDVEDPAHRIGFAFRLFVRFATRDEATGWILLRTIPIVGPLNRNMKDIVNAEFAAGLETGRLRGGSQAVFVSLGLGLIVMTIHDLLVDGAGLKRIDEAAQVLLTALGVDPVEAHEIAKAQLAITD